MQIYSFILNPRIQFILFTQYVWCTAIYFCFWVYFSAVSEFWMRWPWWIQQIVRLLRLSFSSRYWSNLFWRFWGSWHWIRDEKGHFQQHLSFKKKEKKRAVSFLGGELDPNTESKRIPMAFRFRPNALLVIMIRSFVQNGVMFWTRLLLFLRVLIIIRTSWMEKTSQILNYFALPNIVWKYTTS